MAPTAPPHCCGIVIGEAVQLAQVIKALRKGPRDFAFHLVSSGNLGKSVARLDRSRAVNGLGVSPHLQSLRIRGRTYGHSAPKTVLLLLELLKPLQRRPEPKRDIAVASQPKDFVLHAEYSFT
jgi:hypothetical protein